MSSFKDTFLYKTLGLHIKLKPVIDQGSGHPVILLHGIGRSNEVWNHVVNEFKNHQGYRVVAFDLLGFGSSPKPDWIDYTIDDHAQAIINSIDKLKLREPCIIVGHSMGCLIAVRVAKLRPDLIKQLVLFEMPIFEGLPNKSASKTKTKYIYSLF